MMFQKKCFKIMFPKNYISKNTTLFNALLATVAGGTISMDRALPQVLRHSAGASNGTMAIKK